MNIPTLSCPRYLLPLDGMDLEEKVCDLLILGGGIAGLSATIAAKEAGDPNTEVMLVTKDSLEESNSYYAQGGIAAVLDKSDSIDLHIKDTIDAGQGFADEEIVREVISDGPEAIRCLMKWGSEFDLENGSLALSKEGGHSAPRIVHTRDMTGKEIQRALIRKVKAYDTVHTFPLHFAVDLTTKDGVCTGAVLFSRDRGYFRIRAKRTLLVTGGAGQVYRETTNPDIATGDGMAMAFRAGAEMRDMEFVQFHPTILYLPGFQRILISETARGEGGILRDRYGRRFMHEYHEKAELAPRDTVSRAIADRMESTQYSHVFLDMSHRDREFLSKRFPTIYETCARYHIDIEEDLIPVRPAAHYCIGGVKVDAEGRTSLPGLFAAGEVTSSGLHGANRLGSNSLLEGIVFGRRAARAALEEIALLRCAPDPGLDVPAGDTDTAQMKPDVQDFRNSIKSLLWRCAGIERTRADLVEASELLDLWSHLVFRVHFDEPAGWELSNMLIVARLIAAGALAREESRGVHYRRDFTERDDRRWKRYLTWTREPSSGKGDGS